MAALSADQLLVIFLELERITSTIIIACVSSTEFLYGAILLAKIHNALLMLYLSVVVINYCWATGANADIRG